MEIFDQRNGRLRVEMLQANSFGLVVSLKTKRNIGRNILTSFT